MINDLNKQDGFEWGPPVAIPIFKRHIEFNS